AFSGAAGEKAYLFPIVVRHTVVGMLIAAGDVTPAPLELLCGVAGTKLESLTAIPEPARSSNLVQIGSVQGELRRSGAWVDLTAEDQQLHLKAQRMARVRVAEIRLYHAEALRRGIASAKIYEELRSEIDEGRTSFLQNFLAKSPTMVDYLHLEILRSLAHEDD